MCVLCHADPIWHCEWPYLLQPHYLSPGEKDTGGVRDYSVIAQPVPHPAPPSFCYRCTPLNELHSFFTTTKRPRPNLRQTQERSRVQPRLLSPAVQHLLLAFALTRLTFPSISKRCPSFSSAAFNHPLAYSLSPSCPPPPPLLCFQTENVRWANAIHSLTKGKLGLLLQGLDRLVPEARFSFSLNPHTCRSALCFFFSPLF